MLKIIKLGNSIYEHIEPFTVDEDGNEAWSVPNDINELKAALIDTVKWQAGHNLKDTDWAVVKCTELGLVLADKYPDIATNREAIRQWSNDKEAEINACAGVEELLALDIKL